MPSRRHSPRSGQMRSSHGHMGSRGTSQGHVTSPQRGSQQAHSPTSSAGFSPSPGQYRRTMSPGSPSSPHHPSRDVPGQQQSITVESVPVESSTINEQGPSEHDGVTIGANVQHQRTTVVRFDNETTGRQEQNVVQDMVQNDEERYSPDPEWDQSGEQSQSRITTGSGRGDVVSIGMDPHSSSNEIAIQTDITWLHEEMGQAQLSSQASFASTIRSRRGTRVMSKSASQASQGLLFQQIMVLKTKQPPMLDMNVYKLFDNVMEEKLKADIAEIEAGRQPRDMQEFLLDFLFMQYGLKTLAVKSLGSLIAALEKFSSTRERPYGLLFCRVLGVCTDAPIDVRTVTFLAKARSRFALAQARYYKKQKPPKSVAHVGGEAPFIEVYEIVTRLFVTDRGSGESIIDRLEPNLFKDPDCRVEQARVERTMLILCSAAAKMGRDLKWLYTQIDSQKQGSLTYDEFSTGLRSNLNLWVTDTSCHNLAAWLDSEGTGAITFPKFMSINFKEVTSKAFQSYWNIDKCGFLLCLLEEVEYKKERDYKALEQIFVQFDDNGDGVLTLDEFTELVLSLEPDIENAEIVRIFRQALEYEVDEENLDAMEPSAFCAMAMERNLGGYGKNIFEEVIASDDPSSNMLTHETEQSDGAAGSTANANARAAARRKKTTRKGGKQAAN